MGAGLVTRLPQGGRRRGAASHNTRMTTHKLVLHASRHRRLHRARTHIVQHESWLVVQRRTHMTRAARSHQHEWGIVYSGGLWCSHTHTTTHTWWHMNTPTRARVRHTNLTARGPPAISRSTDTPGVQGVRHNARHRWQRRARTYKRTRALTYTARHTPCCNDSAYGVGVRGAVLPRRASNLWQAVDGST